MDRLQDSKLWNDSQKKRSAGWIAIFLILNVAIPLALMDLYPFSRGPMFSDSPRHYSQFRVMSPEGKELDLMDFGLHRIYWGNPPGSGSGYFLPPTIDHFGSIPDTTTIAQQVQKKLQEMPNLSHVNVVHETVGDVDGNRVGVVSRVEIQVDNPAYSGQKKG